MKILKYNQLFENNNNISEKDIIKKFYKFILSLDYLDSMYDSMHTDPKLSMKNNTINLYKINLSKINISDDLRKYHNNIQWKDEFIYLIDNGVFNSEEGIIYVYDDKLNNFKKANPKKNGFIIDLILEGYLYDYKPIVTFDKHDWKDYKERIGNVFKDLNN